MHLCSSQKTCNMPRSSYSVKVRRLHQDDFERYKEKTALVGGVDPYNMNFTADDLPLTVDYDRIFEHLITKLSFRTGNINRNFKSLDAYKSFQAGFVKEVKGFKSQEVYVVSGKV